MNEAIFLQFVLDILLNCVFIGITDNSGPLSPLVKRNINMIFYKGAQLQTCWIILQGSYSHPCISNYKDQIVWLDLPDCGTFLV